jgi:Tfp pilus assembly protein PilE
MTLYFPSRSAGISLMEYIVATALVSTLAFIFYSSNQIALRSQIKLAQQQTLLSVTQAADLIANDLKEADATSIKWDEMHPASSTAWDRITFSKSRYDASGVLQKYDIDYHYQNQILTRTETRGTDVLKRDVLRYFIGPDDANPLITGSERPMLILTLRVKPDPHKPIHRVVRRIAVRGL